MHNGDSYIIPLPHIDFGDNFASLDDSKSCYLKWIKSYAETKV